MKRICLAVLGGAFALTAMAAPPGAAPWQSGSSSSGGGPIPSKPGPNNILGLTGMTYPNGTDNNPVITLNWAEAYPNTVNNDGTGAGFGTSGVVTRNLMYRTDHPLVTSGDFSTATLVPSNPGIATPGAPITCVFDVPADGMTYYFAIMIVDNEALTTYTNGVTQAVPLNTAGAPPPPDNGSGGGGSCSAAPRRGAFQDLLASAGRRLSEGFPVILLAAALTGLGFALRRP